MSAGPSPFGRKLPLKSSILLEIERPLSVKAAVRNLVIGNWLWNDRYTPDSGH